VKFVFQTKQMKRFKIIPLSAAYARKIRSSGKDEFNHAIVEQVATGLGPCRVSLQPFKPGKDIRILFSHSPFDLDNAYNQPGPVFIHKEEVEPYKDVYVFPTAIKADKESFPITLIGYNSLQMMVFTELVADRDIDVLIAEIFANNQQVDFLHARNSKAACFICKIERVN
jgi:hypothetical protein